MGIIETGGLSTPGLDQENSSSGAWGQSLIALIDALGISREALAERLGKDRSTVSRWTQLEEPPPLETLRGLVQALESLGSRDAAEVLTGLKPPPLQLADERAPSTALVLIDSFIHRGIDGWSGLREFLLQEDIGDTHIFSGGAISEAVRNVAYEQRWELVELQPDKDPYRTDSPLVDALLGLACESWPRSKVSPKLFLVGLGDDLASLAAVLRRHGFEISVAYPAPTPPVALLMHAFRSIAIGAGPGEPIANRELTDAERSVIKHLLFYPAPYQTYTFLVQGLTYHCRDHGEADAFAEDRDRTEAVVRSLLAADILRQPTVISSSSEKRIITLNTSHGSLIGYLDRLTDSSKTT